MKKATKATTATTATKVKALITFFAFVAFFTVFAVVASYAGIDSSAGTDGASFMKIGMGSARAWGLGRAYVALAEGADAIAWNPAGLSLAEQRELAFSYTQWVQGVSGQYVAYVQPTKGRTVLGVNAAHMSIGGFDARDEDGVPITDSNIFVRDLFFTLSASRSFLYEKLFLGASLKWVSENNAGTEHNSTVGDVGALFKPTGKLSFGLAVQNFGASGDVASTTRGGLAYRFNEFVLGSLELSKDSDNKSRAGLGFEFLLPEEYAQLGQAAFRVGYFTADDQGESTSSFLKSIKLHRSAGLSLGVGLFTSQAFGYGIGLDYAFVPMGALGIPHQFMVNIKF